MPKIPQIIAPVDPEITKRQRQSFKEVKNRIKLRLFAITYRVKVLFCAKIAFTRLITIKRFIKILNHVGLM